MDDATALELEDDWFADLDIPQPTFLQRQPVANQVLQNPAFSGSQRGNVQHRPVTDHPLGLGVQPQGLSREESAGREQLSVDPLLRLLDSSHLRYPAEKRSHPPGGLEGEGS
jgi:hypothetical protein